MARSNEGLAGDLRAAPVTLVDVGESKLAHRVVGSGPDVVLVHGWPLHSLTWRDVVPGLAAQYRCHTFDLPGAGASEWSSATRFRIDAHARALVRAIDAVGIERCAFVGHDSGAAVGRYAAAELGARVWGNVVSGSEIPGHHPLLLQLLLVAGRLPGGRNGLRSLLRSPMLRRSIFGWGACFHDVSRAEGEFHALFGEPIIRSDRVLAGQLGLTAEFDWALIDALRGVHAKIAAPTLLLWGDRDPYFPVGKAREMASQFGGGAELESYPDARLFVHEEHPQRFAASVARFLAPLAPRVSEGARALS